MNYLEKIWKYKRQELEATMRKRPLADVKAAARDLEAPRPFYEVLTAGDSTAPRIIAEIKKASPSRGVIVSDFDPVPIAEIYERHGASALSVLTDEHFFQGQLSFIAPIKQVVGLPILRKDFTLHEYQVYEARAAGADAVLLIARMLGSSQLDEYRHMSRELAMTTLIEVHDEADVERIQLNRIELPRDKVLLGINNRDLTSFETDLATSESLKPMIRKDLAIVAESGIHSREDIERLEHVGIHIFLIGESLLRSKNIGSKLIELKGVTDS